ncbi:MAG: glycosyltransferase [bacterium]
MMTERLLYISSQCPYPATDGGKISLYYSVTNLSKYFRIYLFFPAKKGKAEEAKEHFRSLGINVYHIDKQTIGKWIDLKFLLLNIGDPLPFKWRKYYSKEALLYINKLVFDHNIRLIFVNFPHMMSYAAGIKRIKPDAIVFFREHNIEYTLVEQFGKLTRNPIMKKIAEWQLKKSKAKEVDYWRIANRIFYMSDYDYKIATSLAPEIKDKSKVLYEGFNMKFSNVESVNNSDFIYTANLRIIQNDLSFNWFIEKIWLPNLRFFKKLNVHINITGNDTEFVKSKLRRLGSLETLNIRNIGFVQDIDKEIRKYKYVLSPTVIGSGIRLKVLNGMACGKPVFATPLDLKTSNVFTDMENIVCFEDAKSFVDKFQLLETEPTIYRNICQNALNTIRKYFSWEKYAETIHNEFTSLLRV